MWGEHPPVLSPISEQMGLDCIRKVAEQASTPFSWWTLCLFLLQVPALCSGLISFSDRLGPVSRSKPFPLSSCFLAIMAFITAKETKWGQKKNGYREWDLALMNPTVLFWRKIVEGFWSFGLEKPWVVRISREKQMEVLFVKLQRKAWDPPPRFYHGCSCDIFELRICGSSWAWWRKTITPAEDCRRQGLADLREFQLGLHRQTVSKKRKGGSETLPSKGRWILVSWG